MKKWLLFVFLLGTGSLLFAQQQRVIHQTFDLADIGAVHFDLRDAYDVELWAGASLLVETTIKMWEETAQGQADAPDAIFKHFLEKGRYHLSGTLLQGKVLKIQSKDMQRALIRTAKGICSEEVSVRLLLPDTFQKTGDHSWQRMEKQ